MIQHFIEKPFTKNSGLYQPTTTLSVNRKHSYKFHFSQFLILTIFRNLLQSVVHFSLNLQEKQPDYFWTKLATTS